MQINYGVAAGDSGAEEIILRHAIPPQQPSGLGSVFLSVLALSDSVAAKYIARLMPSCLTKIAR
jgi:hypothetical protein